MKNRFIKFILLHKKKAFIGLVVFIFVCLIFMTIYKYVNPKKDVCRLEQNYSNYSNVIEVTIANNSAVMNQVFKSNNKTLLVYKEKDLRTDGFHVVKKGNKLYSSKNITDEDLKSKLYSSGYTCNSRKSKIKIQYRLNSGTNKLEVKTKYKSELKEALINGKNYKKKVKLEDDFDNNKLGKYVVGYKLNVSKYRVEYIYKVINVVDTIPPEITLRGDSKMAIIKGDPFNDPLYDVSDNYDKVSDIRIETDGEVNINSLGTYKIVYTAIDTSGNKSSVEREVIVREKESGLTYINGILLVNKKYSLPSDYNPGLLPETRAAYYELANAASSIGYSIPLLSGFRSYDTQNTIYNNYINIYGKELTDTFSAQPGHSEHQTGLAMDVGSIDDNYGETPEGKWLAENAHNYGFIIRYPRGKEAITGYKYEPWHIRYLGKDIATRVYNSGLTLEEYLGAV